jgi:hypothetical protein
MLSAKVGGEKTSEVKNQPLFTENRSYSAAMSNKM